LTNESVDFDKNTLASEIQRNSDVVFVFRDDVLSNDVKEVDWNSSKVVDSRPFSYSNSGNSKHHLSFKDQKSMSIFFIGNARLIFAIFARLSSAASGTTSRNYKSRSVMPVPSAPLAFTSPSLTEASDSLVRLIGPRSVLKDELTSTKGLGATALDETT